MRRRALTLLTVLAVVFVAAPLAFAQPLPWSRYKRGDVHRGKQRLRVTDRAAANSSVLLIASFLTSIAPSDECTGNSLSLSDGTAVTSTRSSAATCTKSNASVVVGLTTNQPRLMSSGVLREAAATNIALWSEDISNGVWHDQGGGTITANNTTAPDGTATADEYKFTAAAAPPMYQAVTFGSLTTSASFSGWVLAKGSGTVASLGIDCSTGGNPTCACYTSDGSSCTVTGAGVIGPNACAAYTATTATWKRLAITAVCQTSHTAYFGLVYPIQAGGGAQTGDAALWGVQMESGARASSYTGTVAGTSVTRNADSLSFTTPAGVVDAEGCVKATVHARSPTTPATWVGMTGFAYQDSTTVAKFNDGTNTTSVTAGTSTDGRNVVMTAGWKSLGSSTLISSDGVSATGTYDGAWTAGTTYLGGKSDGSGALNGYVQALYLYNSKTACQ